MSRTTTPFRRLIKLLEELHRQHPNYHVARHLATALEPYGDYWGMTDEELIFAIEQYKFNIDNDYFPDSDIEKIIAEGSDLEALSDKLFEEAQDGDY